MKSSASSAWIDWTIVAAAFAMAGMAYPALPAVIPTHWNAAGVADGFMPKSIGVWLLPATMGGVLLVLLALPRISPRGFEMSGFQTTYAALRRAVLGFFLYLNALTLLAGLGHQVSMTTMVWAGVGMLFAAMGNSFSKLRKNFFVGIRTPWTLASSEVWERTHRFGGRICVVGGIAMFALALAGKGAWLLPIVLMIALVPCVYSYVIYRRLQRAGRI